MYISAILQITSPLAQPDCSKNAFSKKWLQVLYEVIIENIFYMFYSIYLPAWASDGHRKHMQAYIN